MSPVEVGEAFSGPRRGSLAARVRVHVYARARALDARVSERVCVCIARRARVSVLHSRAASEERWCVDRAIGSDERRQERGWSDNGPLVQQLGAAVRRGARVRARLRESAAQREGAVLAADVDQVPNHRVGHRPIVQRWFLRSRSDVCIAYFRRYDPPPPPRKSSSSSTAWSSLSRHIRPWVSRRLRERSSDPRGCLTTLTMSRLLRSRGPRSRSTKLSIQEHPLKLPSITILQTARWASRYGCPFRPPLVL